AFLILDDYARLIQEEATWTSNTEMYLQTMVEMGQLPAQVQVYADFKEGIQAFKGDRKSTRLNSSHVSISYAVFCLKKKKQHKLVHQADRRRRNRDGIPVQEQPVRVLAELIAHDRCCQTSRHGHQRWLHGRDRHERL